MPQYQKPSDVVVIVYDGQNSPISTGNLTGLGINFICHEENNICKQSNKEVSPCSASTAAATGSVMEHSSDSSL